MTQKQTHTPGPWRVVSKNRMDQRCEAGIACGPSAAVDLTVSGTFRGVDELREFDARVQTLAAAPNLLAACKSAADDLLCDNYNDGRGRCDDHDTEPGWERCNPCTVRAELRAAIAKVVAS